MPRIVFTPLGLPSQPYTIKPEYRTIKIGRAEDNHIHSQESALSSHHAVIERVLGGHILRDLHSTNGIALHGTPMEIIDLKDGMTVSLGSATLSFFLSDEEKDILNQEPPATHQQEKKQLTDPDKPQEASSSSPRSKKSHCGIWLLLVFLLGLIAGVSLESYVQDAHPIPKELRQLF